MFGETYDSIKQACEQNSVEFIFMAEFLHNGCDSCTIRHLNVFNGKAIIKVYPCVIEGDDCRIIHSNWMKSQKVPHQPDLTKFFRSHLEMIKDWNEVIHNGWNEEIAICKKVTGVK